jgi:hypothetical protein
MADSRRDVQDRGRCKLGYSRALQAQEEIHATLPLRRLSRIAASRATDASTRERTIHGKEE